MATPSSAEVPTCSRCGGKGTHYPATNQWGCDKCQMLPMQQGTAPMGSFNPYGPSAVAPARAAGGYGMSAPSVSCPRCGALATFYAQTNQWGCDRCQMPVAPAMVLKSGSEASSDAGTVVLKVVGTIIMIIILTAIRVALR